ncbi:MAG: glycosyltransferase [Acidimicrobiales bacterium]
MSLGTACGHLTQILAGLAVLAERGELEVAVRPLPPDRWRTDDPVLRVELDDGQRVAIDLRDGTDVSASDLDWCTGYRKRSYATAAHGGDERITPLGLNFPVSHGSDWRASQVAWTLRRAPLLGPGRTANLLRLLARGQPRLAAFEAGPDADDPPGVLLVTRVWDPRRVSGEKAAAWEAMNEQRADCVRALADALGERFVGGLSPSPWAIERYGDLVLGDREVRRDRYLARVRSAAVCVATSGLRSSNGWRLAEYLAASRAVVSEPLHHEVPGTLGAGAGLATFRDADELVRVVQGLLEDPDRRRALAVAGHEHYRAHVRPDALVRAALGLGSAT